MSATIEYKINDYVTISSIAVIKTESGIKVTLVSTDNTYLEPVIKYGNTINTLTNEKVIKEVKAKDIIAKRNGAMHTIRTLEELVGNSIYNLDTYPVTSISDLTTQLEFHIKTSNTYNKEMRRIGNILNMHDSFSINYVYEDRIHNTNMLFLIKDYAGKDRLVIRHIKDISNKLVNAISEEYIEVSATHTINTNSDTKNSVNLILGDYLTNVKDLIITDNPIELNSARGVTELLIESYEDFINVVKEYKIEG